MPYKPITKICEHCKQEFTTKYTIKQKFCSKKCSGFASIIKHTPRTLEQIEKQKRAIAKKYEEDPTYKNRISNSLKKTWKNQRDRFSTGDKQSIAVGKATRGKYKKEPKSLYELSTRTIRKILHRLKVKCCICGWNQDICDIHHINGRKIENPHNHNNLTLLCPNCHRLIQNNKIDKNQLKTITEIIGDSWLEHYYG